MKNLSLFDRRFLRLCHIQAEPSHQFWSDERFLKSCGIAPLNYEISERDTELFARFLGKSFSAFMADRRADDIARMIKKYEADLYQS